MPTQSITVERELTETEIAELGKRQAHHLQSIGQLTIAKKQSADDFKARIGDLQKEVNEITFGINRGLERSTVDCDVLLNTPVKGKKTYIDLATGKPVKEEDMTDLDKQSRLFDEDDRDDPAEDESEESDDE